MTDKAKNKKIEALIAALFSADKKEVFDALKKIPKEGDPRVIIPMLRAYKAWSTESEVQTEIEHILKQLKAEGSIAELITALEDSDFANERAFVISIFWNAGLLPIDDVSVLVRHAVQGDYMIALEVLTVIENIDAKLDDNMVAESIDEIEHFLDQTPDAPHAELLYELKQVLTSHQDI